MHYKLLWIGERGNSNDRNAANKIVYLIYKVAFEVPKDIKRLESKVDNLHLHLKEIEVKLS